MAKWTQGGGGAKYRITAMRNWRGDNGDTPVTRKEGVSRMMASLPPEVRAAMARAPKAQGQ